MSLILSAQGHLSRVNLLLCLERVAAAVGREDTAELSAALEDPVLGAARLVRQENIELYLTHLQVTDFTDMTLSIVFRSNCITSCTKKLTARHDKLKTD